MLIDMTGSPAEDRWVYAQDDREFQHSDHGESNRSVVRLEHWEEFKSKFGTYASGLWVAAEQDTVSLAPLLGQLALIVIEFPKSRDGRGFTLARMLRERHHFAGDIRAVGPLLPDQFALLLQCGFTSVLAAPNVPLVRWRDAAASLEKAKSRPRTFLDRLSRPSEA